jgi:hypothetical protein
MAHTELNHAQSESIDLNTLLWKENIEKKNLCCQIEGYSLSILINIE